VFYFCDFNHKLTKKEKLDYLVLPSKNLTNLKLKQLMLSKLNANNG